MDLNTLCLCFVMAICVYALVAKASPDWNPERFLGGKKAYWIVASLLLLLAVFIRVYKFGMVPAGLNQDGAMASVDANALAHYGTDRFGMRFPVYFQAWGYSQMGVLLSYCMVPFIWLFGLSVTVIRLPMLLASLAGVWVLFRFSEKLFGKLPALIVLAVVAINPWQIMQSRWALESNLLPHFLLFSVYFFYLGLGKRRLLLYLSMVFFGLTMYSYGIAFYSVPLLLLVASLYLLLKKRIKLWEAGICAFIYFFFAWPIFAVVIINTFRLQTLDTGLVTIPYFPDSIRMNDLIIYSKDFFQQLLINIQSVSDMALLEKGDFNWNYISGYGQMYLFTLPFVLVGLWRLLRWNRRKPLEPAAEERPQAAAGRFLLVAWLAVALFSGLMVNRVNTNRINILFYPMCMLAGLGIWHVLFEAVKVRKVALVVAVIYAISFGGFTAAYFGPHNDAISRDFCDGFTDAVKYADGLGSDALYITTYSRSQNSPASSEILTMFGAQIDAKYFQGAAPAYSQNGRKLLPYAERYRYVEFDNFAFDQPVGTVYVFNERESDLFDEAVYEKKMFDGFGVAVKTAEPAELPADEGDAADNPDNGDDGQAVG